MKCDLNRTRGLALVVAAAALLVPVTASPLVGDDLFLLQSSFAPNVMIVLDNSTSMDNIAWHEAFDPAATYSCTLWAANETVTSDTDMTLCGVTRTLYHDTTSTGGTEWDAAYLNWIRDSTRQA